MAGTFDTNTSSTGGGPPTAFDDTIEWITVECDDCGEEFTTLAVLTNLPGRTRCHDCRDPVVPGVGGPPPWRENRPFMEYGPNSLGRG